MEPLTAFAIGMFSNLALFAIAAYELHPMRYARKKA